MDSRERLRRQQAAHRGLHPTTWMDEQTQGSGRLRAGVPSGTAVRTDGRQKVAGKAEYAGDVSLPGMCHAALVQSAVACGVIERIDSQAAQAAPGVLAVFTQANLPRLQAPPASFTADFPAERRPPLADALIHYAGQHVALVLAQTLVEAQAAAALILVRYAAAPDGHAATLELAQDLPGTYQPDHFATNDKEALQSARGERPPDPAHRLELAYRTPVMHHNPIEPSATVASWEGERLMLYDSTRWVGGSQKVIAYMLGIPAENVSVRAPFVGGAFGSKGFLWQHVALAAQAARVVGRPVKLVLSRGQMFTSTGHRPRTRQTLLLATDSEGRLQSVEHHTLTETSPVAHFVEPAGMSARNLYATPHAAISHRVSPTNLATPCFMRGPGESPGMFALESAIDEIAEACGQDPLAFRLRNYAERDDGENRPHGREWSSKHLRECYARGAERFGWAQRPVSRTISESMRRTMRGGKLVGCGMATAAYPARRSPSSVSARFTRDGHAYFVAATHEIGCGTATIMEQVAAAALGLPPDRVHFALGDSGYPQAPVAGASQTAASVGPAVEAAALALRGKLLLYAAGDRESPLFGVDPGLLLLTDGVVRRAGGGGGSVPVETLLARTPGAFSLEAEAHSELDEATGKQYTFHSFGAHFCEVEIDPQGLDLRVTRWVAAMDCGRILNPTTAKSQVRGGILFGLGMALLEQTIYDPRTGAPLNANLAEYHLPTSADAPEIEVELIEEPDLRLNPLGVRGIGEIGITGAPAAIANAVYHATGLRVRDLPISIDKVFAGLHL